MSDDLYQEIVLDHAGNPRNFGTLDHPTVIVREANASCGDMIEMQLLIKNGVIVDVKWRGVGCAISTASTSMISEQIKGKTIEQAKGITKETLLKELGLTSMLPTREKCLELPIRTIQKIEK